MKSDFQIPEDRVDKDFFFLRDDGLVHPATYLLCLKSGQNPGEGRLEPLEKSCIDVVWIEICELDLAVSVFELLPEGVGEARQSKFTC